jgi:hypothetical protein
MSKIEAKDPSIHGSTLTSYDFNPEDAAVSASVIKAFNTIRDEYDSTARPINQETVNVDCSEFASLCDYLINQTPNEHPRNIDILDILLRKITSGSQISPEESLKALHTIKQVLSRTNGIGIIGKTFIENTTN